MTDEKILEAYKAELTEEREKYLDLKEKAERKIKLIERKLSNVARAFNQELKEGSVRTKKLMGVEVPARKSNLPGRGGSVPSVPVVEVVPDKKPKGLFASLFEEDEE